MENTRYNVDYVRGESNYVNICVTVKNTSDRLPPPKKKDTQQSPSE